ncbi:hypothetical protein CH75_06445 [Dyella jiangningensis]|nr:hypothetical protein CH75_06445 [Dyella jiangningensis]
MQWIIRTVVLLLACIVLLALFGCTPVKPQPVIPQVVTQTVTKYVQVPSELIAPCPVEQPLSRTVAEAVRVARARKDALIQCNHQLDQIRSLGKSNP